jgi:hypothetical protein
VVVRVKGAHIYNLWSCFFWIVWHRLRNFCFVARCACLSRVVLSSLRNRRFCPAMMLLERCFRSRKHISDFLCNVILRQSQEVYLLVEKGVPWCFSSTLALLVAQNWPFLLWLFLCRHLERGDLRRLYGHGNEFWGLWVALFVNGSTRFHDLCFTLGRLSPTQISQKGKTLACQGPIKIQ